MASPAPDTLELNADYSALSKAPDSHLLARLSAAEPKLQELTAFARSAASQALDIAIRQGEILEILFKRHEGEFAQFLSLAFPKQGDGSDWISDDTARNYRTLWKKRDVIKPPDGGEPPCRSLTEAYIKLDLLPAPEKSDPDPTAERSKLRLSYRLPEGDPESWAPADRRRFLTEAEPIVQAYERAKAVSAAA